MNIIAIKNKSLYNVISALRLPEVNWKLFYFFGMVLFSLMLVFYIFSVNELTRGVYVIKNYNKQINTLLHENKVLSNNLTNNNFLLKTQQRAQALSFEKTKDIKYVQILENAVVLR